MSASTNDERPGGRLENAARGVPANVTDCSSWEPDIPAEAWFTGRLENAAPSVPASVTDCSAWGAGAVWLELVVSFGAEADLAAVEAQTLKLIQAAHDAAPELGLTYDTARSKVVDGDVVIVLRPKNPAGAEDRLSDVIRQFRAALAGPTRKRGELVGAGLRWAS